MFVVPPLPLPLEYRPTKYWVTVSWYQTENTLAAILFCQKNLIGLHYCGTVLSISGQGWVYLLSYHF